MSFASQYSYDSFSSSGHDDDLADKFVESFVKSDSYPMDLVFPREPDYQLKECKDELDANEEDLFGDENDVNFVEVREREQRCHTKCVTQASELGELGINCDMDQRDPTSRLVYVRVPDTMNQEKNADLLGASSFISAPSSRDPLDVERSLLSKILTWHQVMPQFVDFLLAFGMSEHPKDFLYSGFRSEMNLDNEPNKLQLDALGRSGWEIRMCHILRSMEEVESESQRDWPWALRPTATYHSYDAKTGKSVWMVAKANGLIQRRAEASIKEKGLYQSCSESGTDNHFESTLSTHLILCAWAGENWRRYINFIEQRIQELTRGALTEKANGSGSSFEDLQKVHFVEERTNEALLVLQANTSVMHELRAFYTDAEGALNDVSDKSLSPAISTFKRLLDATTKDLTMQQARVEMLLKLLADRKSLLASTLQWRNEQANADLARKAARSAEKMEFMTDAMEKLARETKMEAVNMRIITLVTLFFLPGTFVSVSVTLSLVTALKLTSEKTLMSTPIVENPDDHRIFNNDSLKLFLAIALPLLAVTLATWYALYRWHKIRFQKWLAKNSVDTLHHCKGDEKV